MSFVSILLALLLEQARPLPQGNPVHGVARSWLEWVGKNFDTGAQRHTTLAWILSVGAPAVVTLAMHWILLWTVGWVAAVVWSVAVLYATLGFRQFSFHFTEVRDALDAGDADQARAALARWMRKDASDLPKSEIVREALVHSVLSAHRHVFGVLAWYTVLAGLGLGPAGAVFYRMAGYAQQLATRARKPASTPISEAFVQQSERAWYLIDWGPVRLTALFFAFVGSFEEAVDAWRQHAQAHPLDNDGVVLAATSGAVNVQLDASGTVQAGVLPQTMHLRAVVGLVWRTVVMWMVFLALISAARLLG